jgi:hypothetical protein
MPPQSLHNLLLWDVLEDAGKHSNVIRANTRCYLALYLGHFGLGKPQER